MEKSFSWVEILIFFCFSNRFNSSKQKKVTNLVVLRLSDVDSGVRSDAVALAATLIFLYKPDAHDKVSQPLKANPHPRLLRMKECSRRNQKRRSNSLKALSRKMEKNSGLAISCVFKPSFKHR
jgi:hypothetical protein